MGAPGEKGKVALGHCTPGNTFTSTGGCKLQLTTMSPRGCISRGSLDKDNAFYPKVYISNDAVAPRLIKLNEAHGASVLSQAGWLSTQYTDIWLHPGSPTSTEINTKEKQKSFFMCQRNCIASVSPKDPWTFLYPSALPPNTLYFHALCKHGHPPTTETRQGNNGAPDGSGADTLGFTCQLCHGQSHDPIPAFSPSKGRPECKVLAFLE